MNIAKDIAEAVLETPKFIKTITIPKKRKWWQFYKVGSQPFDIYIAPAKLDTVYALSGLLHEVNTKVNVKMSEHEAAHGLSLLLCKIIATAITNNGEEAPTWLQKAILKQFTSKELNQTAAEVYRRLDYENFFGTIISLKAANMIDTQETEAHGQPSEGL